MKLKSKCVKYYIINKQFINTYIIKNYNNIINKLSIYYTFIVLKS